MINDRYSDQSQSTHRDGATQTSLVPTSRERSLDRIVIATARRGAKERRLASVTAPPRAVCAAAANAARRSIRSRRRPRSSQRGPRGAREVVHE